MSTIALHESTVPSEKPLLIVVDSVADARDQQRASHFGELPLV